MQAISGLKNEQTRAQMLVSNIKQLMQQRDIKEIELSRQTSIPLTTVHNILAGKTTDPRISTLQMLADYFEITVDELFTGVRENEAQPKIQSIPIISWSDCIKGQDFIKGLTPSNWGDWSTIDHLSPYIYGLISKPSMEPRFPKGTTLIINPRLTPDDGDLVVVTYPNTDDATLRQLISDGPDKFLLSVGANPSQKRLADELKIIGVVSESKFSWSKKQ